MPPIVSRSRRTALAAALALAGAMIVPASFAHVPTPQSPLAQVDVYDRVSGRALTVYEKDGRQYIVGVPGHEYAVRIRNMTPRRILAVTSVDGVNVITGDTASPDQSGYVIDAWGSVEIAGWRKSMAETAAFFFTEHSNSYAARTGRPFDVGVIGVAVFAERPVRVTQRIDEPLRARKSEASADAAASSPEAIPAPPAGAASGAVAERRDELSRNQPAAPQPTAKLGTGHGRQETSYARQVTFERASTSPAQIVALQYDRYENLVAMGVVPGQQLAGRAPRPFPGLHFAPDPR
jgi:hypothetical protein